MKGSRAAWLVLAAVLAAASPLPVVADAPPEPHVTDPEGDAREHNSEMVLTKVRDTEGGACFTLVPVTTLACDTARENGLLPGPNEIGILGGLPAPPALDGLAAWFEETPTHLLVRLQVASLDPSLEGLTGEDERGSYGGTYGVSWNTGDPRCEEYVYLQAGMGITHDAGYGAGREDCGDPSQHPWGGGCNDWWWCVYEVERAIDYGTPATVTWKVPRVFLLDGARDASLLDPRLHTGRHLSEWRDHPSAVNAYFQVDGLPRTLWGEVNTRSSYSVDLSDPGRAFTFDSPMASGSQEVGRAPPWYDPEDEVEDPRLDFRSLDVVETPETFGLVVEMAEPGAGFWGAVGLPEGHVVEFGAWPDEDGTWQASAYITMPTYGDTSLTTSYNVALRPRVEEDAPGKARLLLDRAELPFIGKGSHWTVLWLTAGEDSFAFQGDSLPASGPLHPKVSVSAAPSRRLGDDMHVPTYWFRFDTPAEVLREIVRIADPGGDARPPPAAEVGGARPDQFDITYLEGRITEPALMELTIGLRDISGLTVPLGHEAVFYAFGLDLGQGAFMVGYYKQEDDPAGKFFCAEDTSVLTEAQRDPTQAVWTLIDGLVNSAQGGGSGAGGPGTITFFVPHNCLGAQEGRDIAFERFEAATFLVQNPTGRTGQGQLTRVDDAAADGPVLLPFAVPPEPSPLVPAWYAAPFGVANFWDIAGIAVAAAVVTGGGAFKLVQRRRDKRVLAVAKMHEDRDVYRAALQRAVAAGEEHPTNDEVLQALRRRLGISEREHALLEMEARSVLGVAVGGLAEGRLFLGKYRIEKRLGEGGFARTFLARDEKLDRRVVLKVARWDSAEDAKRALREGRMLARMSHDRIVAIHDVEEVAGEVVLVLEYMPQGSLADRLRKGPLELGHALVVADDVLAALEAAHGQGVVHRDVKPANILLTAGGRAKLADFGIARGPKGMHTAVGASAENDGAGTLAYMAPEQARGTQADHRADLYALGAVLYEALAGRTYLAFAHLSPFDARAAILEDAPDLPLPDVPAEVNALLARALAKEPAQRPGSAAEMRRALAAVAAKALPSPAYATAPESAHPPGLRRLAGKR